MTPFNAANKKGFPFIPTLPFWALPAVSGCSLLLLSYLIGAFTPPKDESSLRLFNAALAMPIFIVYGWLAVLIVTRRSIACLTRFTQTSQVAFVDFEYDIKDGLRRNIWWSIGLGLFLTGCYLYFEDLFATGSSLVPVVMNSYAALFWITNCLILLQLFFVTRYVIQHFLDKEKIDLFGIKKLLPISDLVVTNTIICSFGLALIPLFWIGRTVPLIDKIIVLMVFLLLSSYLFWPVFEVQKIISRKKRLSINRINLKFQTLFEAKLGESRRLTDDPQRLRQLSALISAKQEISSASEWPIDLPQGLKGVLISLSIPMSWVAGSLVESLISTFF